MQSMPEDSVDVIVKDEIDRWENEGGLVSGQKQEKENSAMTGQNAYQSEL